MRRLILAAVIGMAAIPSVASAHDRAPGAYMVVIPVRDLDLGTPAGAAALRGRASRAASDACFENVRPLRSRHQVASCRADFMGKVERHIETASRRAQTLASR